MDQPYERPAWAFEEEVTPDGQTVFRDKDEQRLTTIALTDRELSLRRRGLAELPQDELVATLRRRLISEDDIKMGRSEARHT